jgi:hypothetical protein
MLDSFGSSIIIKNDYSGVARYTVSYAVSPGVILSLDEQLGDGFFLMPGEQKIIDYNVSLPFKGNYSLSFNIADSKANSKTELFNYEVFDCHNVGIKILSNYSNYCLRQIMPYQVIINNTGKYAENLSVMINNDPFSISLLPMEYKEYNMEFYSINLFDNQVRVSAKNEFLSENAAESFNVRNCDTTAIVLEDLKACPGQPINSSITLKNLGFSTDAYQIINSSGNIAIDAQVFTLESKEQKTIPFVLIPACNEIGLKNSEITIYSLNSGLINSKITYEALNCFDFQIEEKSAFLDYCEDDNRTLAFGIKNKGLMADSYTALLTYGNQQKSFNFYMEPKESVNISIGEYFNYSGNAKYELTVKSNNYCEKTRSAAKNFTVQKFKECYSAKLELQKYFSEYSTVKVTNNGSRQNDYSLAVFNYSQISNMSFLLNPGQSKEYQLNNLGSIMNDYGISVFSVNLLANGVDITGQTSYSDSITGMIILSVKKYYSYAGLALLAILSALFVKNNVLKSGKSNIKA